MKQTQFNFKDDAEIKEFMKYFKGELPDPKHYPIKVRWLADWWFTMVKKDGTDKKGQTIDVHV